MSYTKLKLFAASGLALGLMAGAAQAQDTVGSVTVTTTRPTSLDAVTTAGSRLGLSVRETPATIYTLDSSAILGRGLHTVEEATRALPGVLAAFPPGDVWNFSMRGFTGNQVTLLYNGSYYGPAMMIARPGAGFSVDRIEVVKGPAAILFGNGAIGGAINVVTKQAQWGKNEVLGMASYGSFDTYDLGLDLSRQVSDQLEVRAVVSQTGSSGYVHGDTSHSFDAAVSALWKPTANFQALLSVDYGQDRPSGYFGSPLLPAGVARDPLKVIEPGSGLEIDKATRHVLYNNLTDSKIKSHQWMPELKLTWSPTSDITLENRTYYINAQRLWRNSEVYSYNATTGLIDRDRFFVIHDQKLWGDRGTLTYKRSLGSMANTLVVGFDYSHLDFVHTRGFPDGDSVDRFNPKPGVFGPMEGKISPTKWDAYAAFFEDTLSLTPKLKAVVGGRYDGMDLDRKNFNFDGSFSAATSFTRKLNATSWRAGLVYDLTDAITPYISYSTGKDLAGTSSSLFLINASQGKTFKLAGADQVEAGIKASSPDRRFNMTAAVYSAKRDNFLTQINSAGDLSNIGSQTSKGVELSADLRITPQWSISGDVSYVHARYGTFVDPDFGIDASGNKPANVADWVGGAWTSYSGIGGLPLEIGGGVRFVSSRYAATDNKLELSPYALVDAYVGYDLTKAVRVTARVKNLFNKAYVQWADVFYPTELVLAAPRAYEVSIIARF